MESGTPESQPKHFATKRLDKHGTLVEIRAQNDSHRFAQKSNTEYQGCNNNGS